MQNLKEQNNYSRAKCFFRNKTGDKPSKSSNERRRIRRTETYTNDSDFAETKKKKKMMNRAKSQN